MACHSQRRAEGGGRTLMAAGGEEGTVATWPKVMAPPRTVCGTTSHPTRILDQNMRCKLDFGNRGAFPGHASNVHVPRESRNTDLTGIVLNSYALGAFMRSKFRSCRCIAAPAPHASAALASADCSFPLSPRGAARPGPRRYTAHRSAVAHNHIIEKHAAATPPPPLRKQRSHALSHAPTPVPSQTPSPLRLHAMPRHVIGVCRGDASRSREAAPDHERLQALTR